MSDLERVLRPKSIAIIGATPDAGKFGGKVLGYLQRHGYRGHILPVNPKYGQISGLTCYPKLEDIPSDIAVDAVLISVPRQQVADIIRQAGRRKAAVAVVFTSGYAEAGAQGRQMQAELTRVAAEAGVRIIGPNAFGFVNFQDKAIATPTATLLHGAADAGPIGLVSHSGGMAMGSIFACARERGLSFSFIIAPGNESDLTLSDFIEFLVDDPGTKVIAACIEGIDDGRRFIAAVERARDRGKPVIVLKVGRSELGRQLALSHTAHLAGEDEVFRAVARQYGVICVDDFDELYLQASLMAAISDDQRRLIAERGGVALISISGGIAAVTGDMMGSEGVTIAELTDATVDALRPLLPEFQTPSNPLDVGAVALTNPGMIAQSIEVLGTDPSVGIIVPALTIAENYDTVLESIVERSRGEVPVVVLWAGLSFSGRGASILQEAQLPYFDTPASLVKAVARLVTHCRAWSAHDRGAAAPVAKSIRAADLPEVTQARQEGRSVLSEWESKQLLGRLGFPLPAGRLVTSEREAHQFIREIGYPVALKLISPDLAHKSDIGAVELRIEGDQALVAAFRRLHAVRERLNDGVDVKGFLLEEMVDGVVEAVIGMKLDPQFGPVVMVGSGGVLVELMKDVAFLVPPFDESQVRETISRVRGLSTLLAGFRGKPAADTDALVSLVMRLGQHAEMLCSFATEIEMNPIIVRARGKGAVVADALIRLFPAAR